MPKQPGPKGMRPKGAGDKRSVSGERGPKTSMPSKGVASPQPSVKHQGFRQPRQKK